jgi:hypothetical protein
MRCRALTSRIFSLISVSLGIGESIPPRKLPGY